MAAAIFDGAARLLIVRQNYGSRRYSLPGGAVDVGKAPDETAIRETLEETGAVVTVDHVIGIYRLETGFVIYVFRCKLGDGAVRRPDTEEIAEVGWFAPDEIPSPVTNTLHNALPDILANERGVVREGLPHLYDAPAAKRRAERLYSTAVSTAVLRSCCDCPGRWT